MKHKQAIKKYISLVLVAAVSVSSLAGCGKTAFGLSPDSSEFGQSITYNNKVDVLWVVDNSNSMTQNQTNIGNQVGSFIDVLDQKGIDYNMAITTTDCGATGEKGRFVGATPVLHSGMANVKQLFAQNIQVGSNGSSLERGMQAVKYALSSPLKDTQGASFFRADAVLAIIYVSNEDDKSGTVQSFIDFFNTAKPDFPYSQKGWIANFIGVTDPSGNCPTAPGYVEPGDNYMQMVNYTGGASQSICSNDLASALTNIRQRIAEMITAYHLGREPDPASIVVTVNGVVLPKDPVNGWTYVAQGYTIQFHGTGIPPAGADVKINYQPISSK